MPAKILDGKEFAKKLLAKSKQEADALKAKGIIPCLAVVFVGNNAASELYIRKKQEACQQIGIEFRLFSFPSEISIEELRTQISRLNSDSEIHGILVQLPLAEHIHQEKILDSIAPKKDVDGFTSHNIGALAHGKESLVSCTAKGILILLESLVPKLEGKNICIVNHSIVIGKPLALALMNRNSTVTICNAFTKNLKEHTLRADILIAATGKKNLISGGMVKEGAIVIDAGICFEKKKLCGDIKFDEIKKKASWITPVPGGVGPMTVACLMENTVIAAKKQAQ